MRRLAPLLAICLVCFAARSASSAAIGFRQLTGTYPVAVQRGTKSTVTVYSNFTLDGAYETFFDEPGVRMTLAEEKPLGGGHNGKSKAGNPFRFSVDVPAEQPTRVYEYRIATNQAVSSIGLLRVTDYPVVLEPTKENGTPATAQSVTLPVTVCGKCDREDVDCFRFEGQAGDEVVCEIFAQRVMKGIHDMISGNRTDYVMDPLLTLIGPNGQVVAQNDNTFGGDSLVACKLPTSGAYVLEVRDCRYGGHPKFTYCVEMAKRPFALAAFPFVVERGKKVEAELIGSFCEQLGKMTLSAAADEKAGWRDMRFNTKHGLLNPLPILTSEHPQRLAPGDNQSVAKAMKLTLPVGVSGRLLKDDEAHYYAFDARKDAYYLFEIESHRRGLPLDGVLEVFDANGKKVEGALADDKTMPGDDMPYHKDPQLYFKAPANGRFVVCVRDLHGRGGPTFAYHLRAEPAAPDFEIKGEYYYAMLAPGTRTVWFARVNRLNGFTGPVMIGVENLPAGVTFEPVTLPPGITDCTVLLSAAPDAKVGASLARVVGQAEAPGLDGKLRPLVREGRITCELQGEGGGQYLWPCRTSLVGVAEKLDLVDVVATPGEAKLVPGGKVEIAVKVERAKDFTEPVNLDMMFMYFGATAAAKRGVQLPPGVTVGKASQLRLTGNGTTLTGKVVLEAAANAMPIEPFPITVLAGANISFTINTIYGSNPIYLTVASKSGKPAATTAAAPAKAKPAATTSTTTKE
jgi:hypothetical protein